MKSSYWLLVPLCALILVSCTPKACCEAVTAQCLACAEDISVEQYCLQNPNTAGCTKELPEPSRTEFGSCVFANEVNRGPELGASEYASQLCARARTAQECSVIDNYDLADRSLVAPDGISDCTWKAENAQDTVKEEQMMPNDPYYCETDADCVVKNVGNCCGYYPRCVNSEYEPDLEKVRSKCEGVAGVCGFPEISSCSCVQNSCKSLQDGQIV